MPSHSRVKAEVLAVTWKTDPQYRCDSTFCHFPSAPLSAQEVALTFMLLLKYARQPPLQGPCKRFFSCPLSWNAFLPKSACFIPFTCFLSHHPQSPYPHLPATPLSSFPTSSSPQSWQPPHMLYIQFYICQLPWCIPQGCEGLKGVEFSKCCLLYLQPPTPYLAHSRGWKKDCLLDPWNLSQTRTFINELHSAFL